MDQDPPLVIMEFWIPELSNFLLNEYVSMESVFFFNPLEAPSSKYQKIKFKWGRKHMVRHKKLNTIR